MHCSGEPVSWNGEMSATMLEVWAYHLVIIIGRLSAPRRWLKVYGIYIFLKFWLRAGSLDLIVMASLASVATFLFSWCIILGWEVLAQGWLLEKFGKIAVFVNCTGDITIVFFYSIFQTSAGFSYIRNVAVFF